MASQLTILYDPDKQVAAIVNDRTETAWGPVLNGENAPDMLRVWIDSTPFDLSLIDSDTALDVFGSFLETASGALADAPAETPQDSPAAPSLSPAEESRQAGQEALQNAGEPPPPAPADTDEQVPSAVAVNVVPCFNCGGDGMIKFGGDEAPQRCNMCQGTGRIAEAVAS